MTTDREFDRTVFIAIQPSTSWETFFPVTVEAVFMIWNIADLIKSIAQGVVVVAPKVFNASVGVRVTDVPRWTIIVIGTATKVVMAAIAANREELRAVAVVDATWSAGHVVTVEAVFMVGHVTDCFMARAVIIQLITTIRDTLMAVAVSVQVSCITDLSSLAVFVGVASTLVIRSSVPTDGMSLWTVAIAIQPSASLCAVCQCVTVEAVVVGRDVTNRIVASTLVVACAPRILNAPAAFVAMVTIGAVAVFNALRRTFVIDAGLPWETIARSWGVSAVASIVNGPDAGGALWPKVELVVEGVCPLVSLLTLALEVAVVRSRSTKTEARTGSAFKEASLVSWTTLPETAAVLGMLVVVRYVMVGVDVLGAVWNLAAIVGKAILSGENTVRPS